MRYLKALLASAFLFSASALFLSPSLHATCQPPAGLESAALERVIDGDTLLLRDGRRLRLIGINTPELARGNRPAEPLSQAARQAAQRLLDDGTLQLLPGAEPKDRHGRLLAHVFNAKGQSLEEQLISQGLGFQLSMPPNLDLRECLQAAEAEARKHRRGVWDDSYFFPRDVRGLTAGDGGFGHYRGRVSRVGSNRSGPYLELDERLYVPIAESGQRYFTRAELEALQGAPIELRGWLSYRELSADQKARQFRPFRLYLNHPDHLRRLAP